MTLGGDVGGGRCRVRRKAMAGGRGTAETKIIDSSSYDNPKLNSKITEKPSRSLKITKIPPATTCELDFYTQAGKTLSFLSPFGSDESQASVSGTNTLPTGVSHFLSGRHWENNRKRHKKSHSCSEKKSSAQGKPRGNPIWLETEDYFRQLVIDDVERLQQVSNVGISGKEKYFLIPPFDSDDNSHIRYNRINRILASARENAYYSSKQNGVELSNEGPGEGKETALVQGENGLSSMDVDVDEGTICEVKVKEEIDKGKRENGAKVFTSFSGVEWLLGSRSKVYLASERPSKKRKLLGRDAGLEKLLVACPVEGLNSVCHYCSYEDMSDPLNCLIKCDSCGMVVHQRCYGVQEDVDSSWLCSWCKLNSGAGLNSERPCLLCPKPGGALKPVQKTGLGSEDIGSEVGFAHLFCCQWMPEVYLESTRTMEPIMNLDEVNDSRRKLNCYLCKVKWGACVRCSNGACRTAFHPICAREARHRLEIWGKLGYDEVELRAFCSKHSEAPDDSGSQKAGDLVMTDELHTSKLNDSVMDGELLHNEVDSESHPRSSDERLTVDKAAVDTKCNDESNACSGLNMILKKLIDLGKVDAKDVASEIGVLPDSLNTMLSDNELIPELQYKLLKWLKNHAHIGSLQNTLKVRIRSLAEPKAETNIGSRAVSVKESENFDTVPVKSVPTRRKIKGTTNILKGDLSCSCKDNVDDVTIKGVVLCCNDSNGVCLESLPDVKKKMSADSEKNDNSANDYLKIEDELLRALSFFSEDGPVGRANQSEQTTSSPIQINEEIMPSAHIHPFIYSQLLKTTHGMLKTTQSCDSAGARKDSQLEASSSSGLCCNNYNLQSTSGEWISSCKGADDQFVKSRNVGVLELSPVDEVEGELIYYQHKILTNAVARKRISDGLISKVARSLPQEIDSAGKLKWDAVLVSQYNHELREAKKLGRKERRNKEAQAVLAAATAAAAASSRISSIRKDTLEESTNQEDLLIMNSNDVRPSQLNPRGKDTISRSALGRPSLDGNAELLQIYPNVTKEHPRICEICRRSETVLNPILVCTSCKVAVHMDCYRSVKSTTGPWHCELCEDLFSSQGSGAMATNSLEKPYFVAECGLCGGTASAFRKSVDGQWLHALCAEWLLESTYRRGQVNPIEGMETLNKGIDACNVCRRKQGVCLKCSYGHCQSTFHPTCARSAGFYMTVRTSSGKLQHKAYCEKHSLEQRAKADTHKHGVEEFKSLKQVRVELERLRLLCERIIKREKLKRELVLCSHDILASSRDSVLSALARHPFYQPEVSSESATTSIKGHTDGYRSGSETVQRSDDITVDSTVAGKRRVKIPMSMENDQKTDDSSTSQNLYTLKPIERVTSSGKQIQRVSGASQNILEDLEARSKYRKQTETFEKELIMTSDQASMKNQRLPKGFIYVPILCLSKEKDTVPDACSREPVQHNG